MAPRRRYQLEKVIVWPGERRGATWTFGGSPVAGTEQSYAVRDENFSSRNEWEFIVRIPSRRDQRIEVRPRTTPNVKAWAELPDRSLTFVRATKGDARGKWYCPIALADPTGAKSRTIVRADQRDQLPRWFDVLRRRMRVKEKVRSTRGTDAKALVLLVPPDDHTTMIRFFFATKVWIMTERVTLEA
jgi:hypothetical protein